MSPPAPGDSHRPILITGGTGQVGAELIRALSPLCQVVTPGRADLNLAYPASIRAALRALQPKLIINAAAYTAVDRAESDENVCMAINSEAPAVLAEEARDLDAALMHFSTDYVFDGLKTSGYVEDDPTAPLSVYGRSKELGEQAVASVGGAWMIFRCSWVYSLHGSNFLKTMLRFRDEKEELKIVDDQVGAPTWAREIAKACSDIARQGETSHAGIQDFVSAHSGIYHMTASGHTTWKSFAESIFAKTPGKMPAVKGIPTSEYPTAAVRPMNSVLDNTKLKSTFGVALPDWDAQLTACLAEV